MEYRVCPISMDDGNWELQTYQKTATPMVIEWTKLGWYAWVVNEDNTCTAATW
eukprot:m.1149024 g.1149024  ORF g.1149024 m.1149024 type:complete len:53 (+) comp24476_c0_seq29:462-620(+)